MNVKRKLGRLMAAAGTLFVLVVGAGAYVVSDAPGVAHAAGTGPCDIYASGGTPCVAAHSTTRALFGAYNGPLYQVRRSSDNTTRDIGVLSAGGYANAATQDSFCAGTYCVITIIYDQSGRNNDLTIAPRRRRRPRRRRLDNLANATAPPVTAGGHKAYGVYISAGTGYRNNATNGVATGDQPEGMYVVIDGTHYNERCCFDYGNAETTTSTTATATWRPSTSAPFWFSGAGTAPGHGRPGERPVRRGQRRLQRQHRPQPPLRHRHAQGRPHH